MRVPMQGSSVRTPGSALQIDAESGWMRAARRIDSPNSDERPIDCRPELIVLHGISLPPGKYGGPWIEALFTNTLPVAVHEFFGEVCGLRVSAHLLIDRNGGLTQFVPFHRRAWHAGESCHRDRTGCNDFSIGIELEGTDDRPYTSRQYDVLSRVVAGLRTTYHSLHDADIVGHSDIAPGRKTDPGPAFDWGRLEALLIEIATQQ